LPCTREHPQLLDECIAKDLRKGFIAGPYKPDKLPYAHSAINPSGIILEHDEDGNITKARRIVNLSHPSRGPGQSVNAAIEAGYAPTSHLRTSEVIEMIASLGPNARLTVIDIASAFRHIDIHPDDVPYLGFRDSTGNIYYETTLPFGMTSSPGIWDSFALMLEWKMANIEGFESFRRYVDDFILASPADAPPGHNSVERFLALCKRLGLDIATDKIIANQTTATYMGFEFEAQGIRPSGQRRPCPRCPPVVHQFHPTVAKSMMLSLTLYR
jgi:hypothetical protein